MAEGVGTGSVRNQGQSTTVVLDRTSGTRYLVDFSEKDNLDMHITGLSYLVHSLYTHLSINYLSIYHLSIYLVYFSFGLFVFFPIYLRYLTHP